MILAAGAGSRFAASGGNTHKLLADFRGRPLVAWGIEHACGALLDETVVVTGAAVLPPGVTVAGLTVLYNGRWAEGQATSLAQITALLRADKSLNKQSAIAIEEILKAAYNRFREPGKK